MYRSRSSVSLEIARVCEARGAPWTVRIASVSGAARSPPFPTASSVDVSSILGAEVMSRCAELGAISDSPEHRERTFLSPAWGRAALLVSAWMEDAGLEVWMDGIGNVRGRTPASLVSDPGAPAMMLGSHFDTIIDAGAFDGPLVREPPPPLPSLPRKSCARPRVVPSTLRRTHGGRLTPASRTAAAR